MAKDFSNPILVSCEMHKELMINGLWNAFKAQNSVDLNLMEWGGKSLVAHQVVADIFLSSQKLLSGTLSDLRDDPDQLMTTVELLLEFMYTGRVQVDQEKLDGLLDVAQRLNFVVLVDAVLRCSDMGEKIDETAEEAEEATDKRLKSGRKGRTGGKKIVNTDAGHRDCLEEESASKRPSRIKRAVRKIGEEDYFSPTASAKLTKKVGKPSRITDAKKAAMTTGSLKKPKTVGLRTPPKKRRRVVKEWAIPICQLEEREKSLGKVDKKDVVEPPKEKMFKCGHCEFSSLDKDQAFHHIRTVHVKPAIVDKSAESVTDAFSSSGVDSAGCNKQVHEYQTSSVPHTEKHSEDEHSDDDEHSEGEAIDQGYEPAITEKPSLKCPECEYQTTSEAAFRVHLVVHDPSVAYFKCWKCEEPFPSARSFQNHADLLHPDAPLYLRCARCPYRPSKVSFYLDHLRSIHGVNEDGEPLDIASPRLCRCPDCSFTCTDVTELQLHVRTHGHNPASVVATKSAPCRFQCNFPGCEEEFALRVQRKEHQRTHLFKCENCDFTNPRKCQVDVHNRLVHLRIRPHMCETCGYRASSRNLLAKHVLRHTGERPHVCDVCGRSFTDRSTLARHVKGHDPNVARPFACPHCDFQSRHRYSLGVHLGSVHGPNASTPKPNRRTVSFVSAVPINCPHCEESFRRQFTLNRHVRDVHGPGAHPYGCDICPYTGKTSDDLKKHLRRHTGERPYPCPQCPMRFKDASTFKRHLFVHRGPDAVKAYACASCDSSFFQKRHLNAHRKRVHEKVPGAQAPAKRRPKKEKTVIVELSNVDDDDQCKGEVEVAQVYNVDINPWTLEVEVTY